LTSENLTGAQGESPKFRSFLPSWSLYSSARFSSKLLMAVSAALRAALAPTGILRAGINLSNFLLVSSRGPNGEPVGVAPDMAAALAEQIGVPLELVPYANPGLLGDAANRDEWDVGLIGAEPKRAETIAFTAPYAEIEATFMVPPDRDLHTVADVDRPGVRVCVSARAAYDLWLTANLQSASLTRTEEPGLERSRQLFDSGDFDALAGLRPWLLDQAGRLARSRTLLHASARIRTRPHASARSRTHARARTERRVPVAGQDCSRRHARPRRRLHLGAAGHRHPARTRRRRRHALPRAVRRRGQGLACRESDRKARADRAARGAAGLKCFRFIDMRAADGRV
jgi:polar amino acid transport system substrate-binding protein